jgi:hypothetical protein
LLRRIGSFATYLFIEGGGTVWALWGKPLPFAVRKRPPPP